jgi:hypothetical protein
MVSQEGPAVAARGWEKWIHLRDNLEPKHPVILKDNDCDGSVMRFLGDQETGRGKGYGCSICNWNCERVFVPEART